MKIETHNLIRLIILIEIEISLDTCKSWAFMFFFDTVPALQSVKQSAYLSSCDEMTKSNE